MSVVEPRPLTDEEIGWLRDEPMLVHTFDAYRLTALLLEARDASPCREQEAYDAGRLAGYEEGAAMADPVWTESASPTHPDAL